jgi:tetrahydromethanopterin S-methyltransferase subunit G
MATFTKTQLKQIIKEEYEAVMREPVTEGDDTSRLITKLEEIGKLVEFATKELDYDAQPEVAERLERAEQMIQEVWEEMHNLLEQKPVGEADEGGTGVHDIMNLPEPEAVEPSGNPKEDAFRQIVASSSAGKVDGQMVDLFSASAVVKVLDALSPQNKEKFLDMPAAAMVSIAFKLMK